MMPTAFAKTKRIRMNPPSGRATEKDVTRFEAEENRLFELVDGVLVEKAMRSRGALLATRISQWILNDLDSGEVLLGSSCL